MSYLDRLLIPEETVVHRSRRSLYPTFAGPVLATAVTLAAAGVLALLVPGAALVAWVLPLPALGWLAGRWLWWTNKVYMVTTHRVLKLEGVFTKSHSDASLDKINDMTLVQGLLGRLLGWGDLAIATANEDATVTYHLLHDPVEFKRQALMSRAAGRSGEGPAAAEPDPIEQLERLGALREKGVVTEGEFQAAKAQLLGKVG
jgi:uncharacterized membrane protein YdbT with pleckstrin-like domain